MRIRKIITLIIVSCLLSFASSTNQKGNLLEKVYTQTDRTLYFPGETIWFKSYITNAENKASTISEVLYAELISSKGTVAKEIKLSINQGYAYGDFEISKDWVGGIYKVRMYTNWMKNFGNESYFEKEIIVQKVISPNLLMTLEFEKKAYGKGSNVMANFEVKNLKNIPLANHEIKFEVKIKGAIYFSDIVKTDHRGKREIEFKLPDSLTSSDVVLNVLVPQNGTRESISRSVPVTLDKIDLQFFPESGNALIGVENQIAFKAVNEFGKPADISGEIVDENGQFIKSFQSYHDGMGSFSLVSKSSHYFAKIKSPFKSDSMIPLPKMHISGTKFSLKNEKNHYSIVVYSTSNRPLYLTAANAHRELFTRAIKISNNEAKLKIKKSDLSTGIIKISLADVNQNIVAERLVFANSLHKLNIDISLDKEQYETREKVTVKIKTTNKSNQPVPSNLSISIADNKLVSFADDKQNRINSYLLMSSELKGKIHKPSFYFDSKEEKAEKALSYIMLTHGWRTYIQNDLTIDNAVFQPDTKAVQFGKIVDNNYRNTKAHLLLFDENTDKVLKFDTNANGEFSFVADQKSRLVLLAYTDDHKKIKIIKKKFVQSSVKINKSDLSEKSNAREFKVLDVKKPIGERIQEEVNTSKNVSMILKADNFLDEVVIVGYGIQQKKSLSGSVSSVVGEQRISDLNIGNIGQLAGRVAGIQIVNTSSLYGGTSNITIRGSGTLSGNSQPLIIIDGIPIDYNSKTGEALSSIDPSNIDAITVLKGAAASAIYGTSGLNGVIIISTKNQQFNRLYGSKSLNNKKYRNYSTETFYTYSTLRTYKSKQFYTPIYESKILPEDRSDFRQTIYWNPVIQTDKNGEASFEYYNSDAITSFIITTEGIGYNGLVGRNETKYSTKKLLNIDFKTPNYMALNDTIQLPIIITNESKEIIKTNLNIELPKELKFIGNINYDKLILKPNSNTSRTITIVPISKTKKTEIKVSVSTKDYSDILTKEVTIISPYFPTQASISGSKNENYQFNVNNVVEGSLKANFSIYTDIVGNVMDGIESLIRQPYGCFEQVSSSTYPNILILKYLKEAGKSNPEVEKKALAFIKDGYKKLAAYETAQNGFEWFGHTPPHETLTAYGILEFTEMKEVFNGVDQKMLDRTVSWLLSRKDGRGGFKKSKKGYDSFTKSTYDVANAYIIYALSESGVSSNFKNEYDASFKKAHKANDAYRLALMALTSYNLDKTEEARILMDKIKANIKKYGFKNLPVENTITRSQGNAKKIETVSFNILALLREGKSEFIVGKGIEYLLSMRQNGRFGSTQATAMALKALIAYTKSQKQKILAQDGAVALVLNGKTIKTKLSLNKNGKIVVENLERYISKGTQHLSVNFGNPEITFPYELNVEWDSTLPSSSAECKLELKTEIINPIARIGENLRMNISVKNKTTSPLPMATAIIGIPSGTSAQPWQLKEILEKNKADYFEVFDNYLVFYWKEFNEAEVKEIQLDLKAEILGKYQAPASTVYLYYADEYKHWIQGEKTSIK